MGFCPLKYGLLYLPCTAICEQAVGFISFHIFWDLESCTSKVEWELHSIDNTGFRSPEFLQGKQNKQHLSSEIQKIDIS